MRKIILFILILFVSCTKTYESSLKVIRYEKFGKMEYDWYDSLKIRGSYCIYIKKTIIPKTNYIYGDFEQLSYKEYQNLK